MSGQFLLKFTESLIDSDGDEILVDCLSDKIKEISNLMKCSKVEAQKILKRLEKDYQVYAAPFQIILARGGRAIYNFERYGQTYGTKEYPHKYNVVDDWDFRKFIMGQKIKTERKKRAIEPIEIACTEIQLKRAAQLWYAYTIGFDIGYSVYKRFYLL